MRFEITFTNVNEIKEFTIFSLFRISHFPDVFQLSKIIKEHGGGT